MLSLLVPMLSGCRHKHKVAYTPPPPPLQHQHRGGSSQQSTAPQAAPSTEAYSNYRGKVLSTEVGLASWYGPPYNKRRGANGEIYNQNAMTAAHRTLPMNTMVRVVNEATGQSAVVRITDRGPFVKGRIIDLSLAAAKATGVYRAGVAKVKLEILSGPKPGADVAGRWCVQVGAFEHEKNALKLKDQMIRRYHTAKVIEFPGPTGHWVRINPAYADKKTAEQVAESIRPAEKGAEAYVVRLN